MGGGRLSAEALQGRGHEVLRYRRVVRMKMDMYFGNFFLPNFYASKNICRSYFISFAEWSNCPDQGGFIWSPHFSRTALKVQGKRQPR